MIGKKCPNIESGQFGDSNMPESSGMPHTFSVDYGWQGPDKQPGQAMSRQAIADSKESSYNLVPCPRP